MLFVKVKHPKYDRSRVYEGQVGEVVGHWGPENSADAREGYLVEFANGDIVGLTAEEVEAAEAPSRT